MEEAKHIIKLTTSQKVTLFLFTVVLTILSFNLNSIKAKLSRNNKKYSHSYLINHALPSPPIFDWNKWMLYTTFTNDNYLRDSNYSPVESKELRTIKEVFPEEKKLIEKKRFSNLYEFLEYLVSIRDFKSEYQILSYYCKNSGEFRVSRNLKGFLSYLDMNYTANVYYYSHINQFYTAKYYADEAYFRLQLIHSPPLDSLPTYINQQISTIYFLHILFSDVMPAYFDRNRFKMLFEFRCDSGTMNKFSSFKILDNMNSYFLGLKEFHRNHFIEAKTIFDSTYQTSGNAYLKDLSLLMNARICFWEGNRINFSNSIEQLRTLNEYDDLIQEWTLRKDIECYSNFITYHRKNK